MTLSRETLMELMAYADGEPLDEGARAQVERLLTESEEARAVVASFAPLGDFVQSAAAERAGAASGIADAVMARIDDAAPTAEIGTSELARARAKRRASAPAMRAMAVAAGVTALAAGAVLLLRPSARLDVGAPTASLTPPFPAAPLAPEPTGAPAAEAVAEGESLAAAGVEVDHVEAADNAVSVIYLPAVATANVNASSVVIWISDDKGSGGL